ncbi:MAG: hypothetical protein V4682_03345 [Patescibacteria group bacterium]
MPKEQNPETSTGRLIQKLREGPNVEPILIAILDDIDSRLASLEAGSRRLRQRTVGQMRVG